MKLAMMFDLAFFKHLLILVIYILAKLLMISKFFKLMGIITCSLDGPLVVMLILGLTGPILLLLTMFLISTTFLVSSFRKVSLIQMMFSILLLKTYVYDFLLLLASILNFDLAKISLLSLRGIKGKNLETLANLPLGEVGIVIIFL